MTEIRGNINVNEAVIKSIVGKCALEIPGVSSLSGSVYQNLVNWGAQADTKGIEIQSGEDEHAKLIDVHITVERGQPIPSVAENLQRAVKEVVERMTGLEVIEVNVYVDDIRDKTPAPSEKEKLPKENLDKKADKK